MTPPTKPLSFWAIRQRSTGFWLPKTPSPYFAYPNKSTKPRLFTEYRHAEVSMRVWLEAHEGDMEIVELRLTEVITRVALINPEDFFASLPGDQSEPSS